MGYLGAVAQAMELGFVFGIEIEMGHHLHFKCFRLNYLPGLKSRQMEHNAAGQAGILAP